MDYPFVPKSIRSIIRGHFWSIPLDDGQFACAIAVEDRGRPDPSTGSPRTQLFMSALLDWVGAAPPRLADVGTISATWHHGYCASVSIRASGGAICGWRDLDAYPIVLPERVTDRSRGAWVVRGSERVRRATRQERESMPGIATCGPTALRRRANDRWSTNHDPG